MPTTSNLDATTDELSPHERAFYGEEARLRVPRSYEELAEIVREAEASRAPIIPAGRGAHAYLGNPPPRGAWVVSLRRLDRVLRYEPGDFTIGVHAGLPLGALREQLLRNDQEVPLDWPRGAAGTVGGLIAAAPPGLRRARSGPVRSLVIGIVAMRSGGRIYKAGGMVVKNVAGYEVMKLLTGSLGTAGIILEVNFKLKPLPGRQAARLAAFAGREAAWRFAQAVRARRLEPTALWILEGPAAQAAGRGVLPETATAGAAAACILEGNAAAVAWQETQIDDLLASEPPAASAALQGEDFDRLTEALAAFPEPGPGPVAGLGIARLAALPGELGALVGAAHERLRHQRLEALSTAADAQCGLVTLRWESASEAAGAPLPALIDLAGGGERHGTLLYLPPECRRQHDFALKPIANVEISRRLLRVFDPGGLFSPGRILGSSSLP